MEDAVILLLIWSLTIAHASEEAGILSGQEEVKVDRHGKRWLFTGKRKRVVERNPLYGH
jgi:hypothetical protein